MDERARHRDDARKPLDLTDAELATAAQACRAMAYQEGKRAAAMESPTMRGPLETTARRYAAVAAKLEGARERAKVQRDRKAGEQENRT
ncbi:MAG TPA: hypothetical protein VLV25_03855 [Steroidobacteraceae bacterium]|nr:hypothetical protein [Steroidobacteraceae bacterium]